MFFLLLASISGLAFLICAALCLIVPRDPERLTLWQTIPRAKYFGSVLTGIVIFWCVPNLRPILEPGSALQNWLIPAAVAAIFLCCFYLDYLFARAFAGFSILLAHLILKESFGALIAPWNIPTAIAMFLFGATGIVLAAKPYFMREWIRGVFNKPAVRWSSAAFFFYTALSLFLAAAVAAAK